VKIKLNKCVKAGKTTGSKILTNDNGIPSRPDASDFTAIKASKTSLESTVIKENSDTPTLTGMSNSFWDKPFHIEPHLYLVRSINNTQMTKI
jgi:hypothetical protein